MKAFTIGKRPVGGDAPVFLVAELSANHGQRRDIALRTIEAAARAGANAIKLQTYTPDTLTLRSSEPPFVVKTNNEWAGRTLYDLYQEAMTPWEWHVELFQAAAALGLECFSTPFDATAVAFLERLDAAAHKVASFELNDLPLVEAIARTKKPVILSTGMATLGDIEAALAVCRRAGNEQLALLRCVSSYPARPETMDLRSLAMLREFDTVIGLSDHTRDITVPVASVALGAKLIEKHFILDRNVGGPDAFFSLDPDEFAAMTKAVRDTEKALGRTRFGPSTDEIASTNFRRSLFVARDVKKGDVITCDDVRSVRPSIGLHPRHLPEVLGRVAARDLHAALPFAWDMIGDVASSLISLQRATVDDSAQLFAWRNDSVTRSMSINQQPVSREDHARWLDRTLADPTKVLLVAFVADAPVGTLRLDITTEHEARVSITIGPAARGHGHAAPLLRAAEGVARDAGVDSMRASIRSINEASVNAFKRAGYYGFCEHDGLVECTRRITPFR